MFDKEKALYCLGLCRESNRNGMNGLRYENLQTFDIDDVQGFSFTKGDDLYIVFRGTDSDYDVIRDLKFWKRDYDMVKLFRNRKKKYYMLSTWPSKRRNVKVKIHAGFLSAWESIEETILDIISSHKRMNIIITGHSFGGALSHVGAFILRDTISNCIEVFSFGSPRVGNCRFAREYEMAVPETCRFVNGNDVFTKLPWPIFFYKHVGELIHSGEKYKWWKLLGNHFGIDHCIGEYEKNLKELNNENL